MSLGYHHTVELRIENYSGVPMRFENVFYKHGVIDDLSEYPTVIPHKGTASIKSKERNWSVLGVSAYVVYDMSGTKVGIAFSCPPLVARTAGKLNVATGGGSGVWDDMVNREDDFAVKIQVGHNMSLNVDCQVSRGWVSNVSTVKFYSDRD